MAKTIYKNKTDSAIHQSVVAMKEKAKFGINLYRCVQNAGHLKKTRNLEEDNAKHAVMYLTTLCK